MDPSRRFRYWPVGSMRHGGVLELDVANRRVRSARSDCVAAWRLDRGESRLESSHRLRNAP